VLSDTPQMIEHGTSKTGRWLRPRRARFALWIAVVEGILVALLHDVTRWTVVIIAIPLILLYGFWGRNAKSDTARQVTWIAGASQALAVLFVLLAQIIGLFVIAFVVLAAIVAIAFFFIDRR
jgi:apolipoprotein N-acyltransferase